MTNLAGVDLVIANKVATGERSISLVSDGKGKFSDASTSKRMVWITVSKRDGVPPFCEIEGKVVESMISTEFAPPSTCIWDQK